MKVLVWLALATAILVPLVFAASSPLLAWRQPIYIVAGFAGAVAMSLLLIQPLLIAGDLPGASAQKGRRVHRWIGGALVAVVIVHVVGLWFTSPPDVIDALLFVSPTPFSAWGVIAMWALFGAAALAVWRRRLQLAPRSWRLGHSALVTVAVAGSVVHAMLIEGTMEVISKVALCLLVVAALARALAVRQGWAIGPRRNR